MAGRTLASDRQDDFSAGEYPLYARDDLPPWGCERLTNMLIRDDGLPYRRGGSSYLSTGVAFANVPVLFWNGVLDAGERFLLGEFNGALATLDAASAPVSIGTLPNIVPSRAVEVGGIVYIDGGIQWAGSRKTASYTTGTVSVTNGSTTVVGAGTAFVANVDAGMILRLGPSAGPGFGRYYVVKSVTDDTHLELTAAYQAVTAAGQPYALRAVVQNVPSALPPGIYVAGANRLFSLSSNRVNESAIGDAQTWPANEYHQLPKGVQILGGEFLNGNLLVFTTSGVWMISNVALSLTDAAGNPQQRLQQVHPDLILLASNVAGQVTGQVGIASYAGSLVVPCMDDVYMIDGVSAPSPLGGGENLQYRAYVAQGLMPARAAVYQGHYFLPLNSMGGQPAIGLVARLQRTFRWHRRNAYNPIGWSRFDGVGGAMGGIGIRPAAQGAAPALVGFGTDRRVHTLKYFTPSVSTLDSDGSAFSASLETRQLSINNGVPNFAARTRVHYELVDPGNAATMTGEVTEDDAAFTSLGAAAGIAAQSQPKTWPVRKRGYGKRVRLTCTGSPTSWVVHSIEMFFRPSGRI